MNKHFLIIFFLAFSISIVSCQNNSEKDSSEKLENQESINNQKISDKKSPDFVLQSTEGKEIKLSDFKDKIVIVDFWATWCPPCRKGIPDLIEIQNEFKNKVVVIGVSLDIQTKKDVIPFMKEYGINYPIVYGNQQVVMDFGNISAIPTSFIIKDGKIAAKHIGLVPKATYVEKIKELDS